MLRRRADHENRDHALIREQWDERHAAGAGRLDEPRADDLRRVRVVHRDRRCLEGGRRDARRLVVQVDPDVRNPVELAPPGASDQAGRRPGVVVDEVQAGELGTYERLHPVEQLPGDAGRVIPDAGGRSRRKARLPTPRAEPEASNEPLHSTEPQSWIRL